MAIKGKNRHTDITEPYQDKIAEGGEMGKREVIEVGDTVRVRNGTFWEFRDWSNVECKVVDIKGNEPPVKGFLAAVYIVRSNGGRGVFYYSELKKVKSCQSV